MRAPDPLLSTVSSSDRRSCSRGAALRPKRSRIAVAVAAAALVACGSNNDDDNGDNGNGLSSLGSLSGSTRDVTVEFREGTNMAATPSPDGQQIAFTAQGALWIIPIAGGTATRITPF